jgi:hypothetical protein
MNTALLLHTASPFAATAAAGVLMVRLGAILGRVESMQRARWCGSCHRRISGRRCTCSGEG